MTSKTRPLGVTLAQWFVWLMLCVAPGTGAVAQLPTFHLELQLRDIHAQPGMLAVRLSDIQAEFGAELRMSPLDDSEGAVQVIVRTNDIPSEAVVGLKKFAGMAYMRLRAVDCGLNSKLPVGQQQSKGEAVLQEDLAARSLKGQWSPRTDDVGQTITAYRLSMRVVDGKLPRLGPLISGIEVSLQNLREIEKDLKGEKLQKFQEERIAKERRLAALLTGDASSGGAMVPPALDLAEVRRRLQTERRINIPSDALNVDTNGTLIVRLNQVGRPVGLALEAGASYSSADRLTANGLVQLVNVLPNRGEDSKKPYSTLSARGRYGSQVRELEGGWDLPMADDGAQLGYGIELKGGYLENDRTALGGTDGQTAFSRRQGGEFGGSLSYDSYSPKDRLQEFLAAGDLSTLPLRYTAVLGLGVKFEDTQVARTVVGGIRSGTAAEARLNGSGSMIRMLRGPTEPGIGRLSCDLLGNHQQGVDGVGGEFSYSRSEVGVALEMQFGFERSRDFVVRELVRVGLASGNLPTLEEFRIGGGSAVRGLQEGELSGRSVVALSGEFGVNLGLLTGVHRAKPDAEEKAKSFWARLDGVYLKGFVDWGRVTSDGGFQGAGRDSAFGTGLMLELPRELLGGGGSERVPSLSLGYAYSPDSRIHRSGMFVVSTSLPF